MTALNKEELKAAIREVIREDKSFLKELLHELLDEPVAQTQPSDAEPSRAERIDVIIKKDFERYKKVFKALA